MTEMRNRKILKNTLFHSTMLMIIYVNLKNKYSC